VEAKDIAALVLKNEDEHIEFKKAESSFDFDILVEYSIALANERGGMIVLGVTDKKPRRIVGTHAYEADLAKIKERLIAQVGLRIDVEEVRCPEGRVLVFHVPSRPIGMPLHVNGRYLMRSGAALTAMSADMLKRIFDEAGPDFTAEICPKASLEDLNVKSIENFRMRWAQKSGDESREHISIRQLLSDAELVIKGKVTYGALILFGTHEALGQYLSQAEVIFEYRHNNASGPAQQRMEFRQGFFSFYDKLWETIDLRNTNQHYQDGLFIWDIKTFNERAVREAILNAVSHRDYRSGASVFVRQYPERIEIVNPGGLMPGITLENILWEQLPRNRRLADSFARCGLVERSGQGMNRIYESCIRESKGEPDFTHTDQDHFWITLNGTIQEPNFLRVLEKIGAERLVSFSTEDFIVIQSAYSGRPISARYGNVAKRLFEEGLLERSAAKKNRPWILARKLYAAVGQQGVHTRKQGLDRETNKALLLKHIHSSEPEGAKMLELLQVLPALDRQLVRSLLRSLVHENQVFVVGKTNSARWHECVK
jgi:ATP-dependent DNA helicase RecG